MEDKAFLSFFFLDGWGWDLPYVYLLPRCRGVKGRNFGNVVGSGLVSAEVSLDRVQDGVKV